MDYEPITKGLREYIERHPTMMHAVGLADLLDNIDAIHRSLEQENERLRDALEHSNDYDAGYKAGHTVGFDEGFASADDWLAEHEGAMEDHGWIKLPLDADGEPIHIGDWIVNQDIPDVSNQEQKVAAITPASVYWWSEGRCHWRYSHLVRHYRPDTFESIIEDAFYAGESGELNHGSYEQTFTTLVARCKALCERTREEE